MTEATILTLSSERDDLLTILSKSGLPKNHPYLTVDDVATAIRSLRPDWIRDDKYLHMRFIKSLSVMLSNMTMYSKTREFSSKEDFYLNYSAFDADMRKSISDFQQGRRGWGENYFMKDGFRVYLLSDEPSDEDIEDMIANHIRDSYLNKPEPKLQSLINAIRECYFCGALSEEIIFRSFLTCRPHLTEIKDGVVYLKLNSKPDFHAFIGIIVLFQAKDKESVDTFLERFTLWDNEVSFKIDMVAKTLDYKVHQYQIDTLKRKLLIFGDVNIASELKPRVITQEEKHASLYRDVLQVYESVETEISTLRWKHSNNDFRFGYLSSMIGVIFRSLINNMDLTADEKEERLKIISKIHV